MQIDAEVVLATSRAITFTCVNEDAEPVTGAWVAVSKRPLTAALAWHTHGVDGIELGEIRVAQSNIKGIATIDCLPSATYFYVAQHEGLISGTDGISTFVDASANAAVNLVFSELWIAGVQFEGSGRIVSKFFSTPGARGTGRTQPQGIALFEKIQKAYPDAIMTSATWTPSNAEKFTIVSAWHTTIGWFVEKVPYQRASEFAPLFVPTNDRPETSPAAIKVVFRDADGNIVDIPGCSLRTGALYGIPVNEGEVERVPEDLRMHANVRQAIGPNAVQVPPGSYRVICPDKMVQLFAAVPQETIDVVAGQTRAIEIATKCRLSPLNLEVHVPNGEQWGQVRVSLLIDGKQRHSQVIYQEPARNTLPPPMVPHDVQFEIRVGAPGFSVDTQFVLVSHDSDVVHVELHRT